MLPLALLAPWPHLLTHRHQGLLPRRAQWGIGTDIEPLGLNVAEVSERGRSC